MGVLNMFINPFSFISSDDENEWPCLADFFKKYISIDRLFFLLVAICVVGSFMIVKAVASDRVIESTGPDRVLNERHKGKTYVDRPDVQKFIKDLVRYDGFIRDDVERIISQAKRSEKALELISRPAEKYLEWKEYSKIFLTPDRIVQGIEFWNNNKEALSRAEKEYAVPASVIVAVIGVETTYGQKSGSFSVLDSLVTLSFDYPPRSHFFKAQLKDFLKIVEKNKLNYDVFKGSYTGAMGIPQFMPSRYQTYAVDFSGDGWADIWKQNEDAIGSVANYLHHHGWQGGMPIAIRARVVEADYEKKPVTGLKPEKTLLQLERMGWKATNSILPKTSKASALQLEGQYGTEYWLGLQNFYVITRYNDSQLYAMAVHKLAEAVKSGYTLAAARVKPQGLEMEKT